MISCLLTGSSGFIGTHLVKRLQTTGFNLITISHDILENGNELRAIYHNYNPKVVINMQAYGNHSTQTDDFDMIKSNIVYTHNLAKIAKESGTYLFVQFGSSSEYGSKKDPMNEDDILEPQTMYAATKASATMILRSMASDEFKVSVVRPFSIYGPGEADFRFIPTAIRKIKYGDMLSLDANAVHDWTYIDDFTNGVLTVINHVLSAKDNYTVFNIGTGKQYTNREIFSFIQSIMKKKTKVKEMKMREHDSRHWRADNTKLKEIGWIPQYDIILGLTHTIAHYATQ